MTHMISNKKYNIHMMLSFLCIITSLVFSACDKEDETSNNVEDVVMPTEGLVAFYPFDGDANDYSNNGNHASEIKADLSSDRFGHENKCYEFNGVDQYIEIPDNDLLSIATSGELSVSVWMKPYVYDFPNYESSGYIHWVGKGGYQEYEWQLRMYNYNSIRPNRISCYAFNLIGGLGAGSYVEEPLLLPEWIHITAVYNFPRNEIRMYKNGVLKDMDTFSGYDIDPENGANSLRIATSDFNSFFNGAIDDLRIYNRVLSDKEIDILYHEEK